jgi:hypothetical protein
LKKANKEYLDNINNDKEHINNDLNTIPDVDLYDQSKLSSYLETVNQKGYIYAVTGDTGEITADPSYWDNNTPVSDQELVTVGAPFHFYFGLRRGASSFDRFRTKWINTNNVTN